MIHFFQVKLYNLAIQIYHLLIKIAAAFGNPRAKDWLNGRVETWAKLAQFEPNKKVIWVHCASLGEFEQGRPIIEKIKAQYVDYQIVLTFFSPSGYQIRKNYELADLVCYLPIDKKQNAQNFIQKINPSIAIFVKYEFWYHHLSFLKSKQIPIYCVSAVFRPNQVFFKWYGGFFKRMLQQFTTIFVQQETDKKLLQTIDIQAIVSGDTRVDRVANQAQFVKNIPIVEAFCDKNQVLVCGSTWPKDETILNTLFERLSTNYKIILAPHEIDEKHIENITKTLTVSYIRYSEVKENTNFESIKVLIIDNIGMLSSIYQYGKIAYIGGGFGKGIHNTLEPLAFGLPVIIGPKYQSFSEAKILTRTTPSAMFSVKNEAELISIFEFLQLKNNYKSSSEVASQFIIQNKGATADILKHIFS